MPAASLPLFPLPTVVLFPNVFLPLHIFEPRYREMVADALAGDRMIGMVLLKPGFAAEYEGRPPVYPIGCSGVITHVERLQDGEVSPFLHDVAETGEECPKCIEEGRTPPGRPDLVGDLLERFGPPVPAGLAGAVVEG